MPRLSDVDPKEVTLIAEPPAPPKKAGAIRLSEVPPEDVQPVEEPSSLLRDVKRVAIENVIAPAGRFIDRFSGAASTRAAVGAAQDSETVPGAMRNSSKAFFQQFAQPPEMAPTGKEIAAKGGFSTEEYIPTPLVGIDGAHYKVSPAGIVGTGVDAVADPTTYIPGGVLAKGAAKAGGKALGAGIVGGAHITDAVTGTKAATKTVEAARMAFSSVFNPKRAIDWDEMVTIAGKNGIPVDMLPEAIEFGHDSIITRAGRVKAEGPLGQADLEKFYHAHEAVRDATKVKAAEIGGGTFTISPQEAGAMIRESYDNAVKQFFANVDITYDDVLKRNPGLKLDIKAAYGLEDKLQGIETWAKGRVVNGITETQRSQAKGLLNSVTAIRQAQDAKDVVGALRMIGEAAFSSKNALADIPADVARLRGLYGDITEGLMTTIEKQTPNGKQTAQRLRASNKEMSEFFGDKSILDRAIGDKKLSDEGLFRVLVENGDSLKIGALRKVLQPDEFNSLKGTFLNGLLKEDFEGGFQFQGVKGRMRTKQSQMTSLLDPNEIEEFGDLVRLGDRFGKPIMSTSGTGASISFSSIKQGVSNALFHEGFIENLKKRARGGSPDPGATSGGEFTGLADRMSDGSTVTPGGGILGAVQSRGVNKSERNAKAAQMTTTQDFDENKGRRDAVRRRIERQGGK